MTKKREAAKSLVTDFIAFIQQNGVIGLAIGVVIGTAVKDLVDSLVTGVITPLIGLVMPSAVGNLAEYKVTVDGSEFLIGALADKFINFLVVSFVIYMIVKLVMPKSDSGK